MYSSNRLARGTPRFMTLSPTGRRWSLDGRRKQQQKHPWRETLQRSLPSKNKNRLQGRGELHKMLRYWRRQDVNMLICLRRIFGPLRGGFWTDLFHPGGLKLRQQEYLNKSDTRQANADACCPKANKHEALSRATAVDSAISSTGGLSFFGKDTWQNVSHSLFPLLCQV